MAAAKGEGRAPIANALEKDYLRSSDTFEQIYGF